MNNKRFSKLAIIFFSVTTIIIFFMAKDGSILNNITEETAWRILIANFSLLGASIIYYYVWRDR